MITYIKKSIKGYYITFPEAMDGDYWEDRLGSTFEDFKNNKWVPLTDAQTRFHMDNPDASVEEVWNMNIVSKRTLVQAKRDKIQDIQEYDSSEEVNSFTIGSLNMWLTVQERQQISTQIASNEAVGRETMTRWFKGHEFTFPISLWKEMLVSLEVYAGDALNVTESHKAAVNALETIEEVDNYDYKSGYPQKLHFNID